MKSILTPCMLKVKKLVIELLSSEKVKREDLFRKYITLANNQLMKQTEAFLASAFVIYTMARQDRMLAKKKMQIHLPRIAP